MTRSFFPTMSRRSVMASSLALAACGSQPASAAYDGPVPALKDIAPFPVGACVPTAYLDDPAWVDLARRHLSQLTPEWELKMEYVLRTGDGAYSFDAPDRIAAFARDNAMRLYCTTLIWFEQEPDWFKQMAPDRFAAEYDRYIAAVVGRYAGQALGWDVVNEAIMWDGEGLRDCLWSQGLGGTEAYIVRAFEKAHEADPNAVLFLNDYGQEARPRKAAAFLRLAERLLTLGVPLGGLGVQAHLDIEQPAGQITAFMRQAAQLGLPIHVSELDASQRREGGPPDLRSLATKRGQQAARTQELVEAFMALPPAQRFGLTTWALRDRDSWLRRPPRDDGKDSLVFFDDFGRPTAMFDAFAKGVRGG